MCVCGDSSTSSKGLCNIVCVALCGAESLCDRNIGSWWCDCCDVIVGSVAKVHLFCPPLICAWSSISDPDFRFWLSDLHPDSILWFFLIRSNSLSIWPPIFDSFWSTNDSLCWPFQLDSNSHLIFSFGLLVICLPFLTLFKYFLTSYLTLLCDLIFEPIWPLISILKFDPF